MKKRFFITLLSVGIVFSSMQPADQASYKKILGVFDGRTPCAALREIMKLSYAPECIKLKWRLTLYSDKGWEGGSYTLEGSLYRKENPGTGIWRLRKGTGTNANIIELLSDRQPPLLLQKMDDNILIFLDEHEKLMVGNDYLSYALNRKDAEN